MHDQRHSLWIDNALRCMRKDLCPSCWNHRALLDLQISKDYLELYSTSYIYSELSNSTGSSRQSSHHVWQCTWNNSDGQDRDRCWRSPTSSGFCGRRASLLCSYLEVFTFGKGRLPYPRGFGMSSLNSTELLSMNTNRLLLLAWELLWSSVCRGSKLANVCMQN